MKYIAAAFVAKATTTIGTAAAAAAARRFSRNDASSLFKAFFSCTRDCILWFLYVLLCVAGYAVLSTFFAFLFRFVAIKLRLIFFTHKKLGTSPAVCWAGVPAAVSVCAYGINCV